MNLLGFRERFLTESAREEHLIQLLPKEGFLSLKSDGMEFTLVRATHRRDAFSELIRHQGPKAREKYAFFWTEKACAWMEVSRFGIL